MKISRIWPWSLLGLGVAGIIISLTVLFSPKPVSFASNQVDSDPLNGWSVVYFKIDASSSSAYFSYPVRLKIPSISVDAVIERVGLTPDGAMDVPESRRDVAWFDPGTHPGEYGSAVIAGHYGKNSEGGSVFDLLHTLRNGDVVSIEYDTGASVSFVVRESRRYNQTADASSVFTSSDGKAHLNLVTCEGIWDTNLQGYSRRLVVFADKIE